MAKLSEPTRPLPAPRPLDHGGWEVESFLTSTEFTIRGEVLVPSDHIIPVIVVPGIMGTNLRAKDEMNQAAKHKGQEVWRPPNGKPDGLGASIDWGDLSPAARQHLFDGPMLEVDDGGPIVFTCESEYDPILSSEDELRRRGWGEVHADSYGELLITLETRLNHTFDFDDHSQKSSVAKHWQAVAACEGRQWGLPELAPLTEAHLEKHAEYHYPVYAIGYNWLESCGTSSQRVERRILAIIDSWKKMKRRCDQVIIVTHSMGGLVTRAAAKRIPDKIAGVIHGVMPALGAPAAYRRMACGTEKSSPSNGPIENFTAARMAKILGETTEQTTPVLAVSPGALELLPNHLYHLSPRGPWLHVRVMRALGPALPPSYEVKGENIKFRETSYDYLHLPSGRVSNPYDLYRDTTSWYRLVNMALVDPAGKFKGKPDDLEKAVMNAINTAENFHRSIGEWYHSETYVFYGADQNKLSFGQVRWVARQEIGSRTALTAANVAGAEFFANTPEGHRYVRVDGETELHFAPEPQDARGDGTVPQQSGSGPAGKVKQVFPMRGYDHQQAYTQDSVLLLTLRLIAKIVQEIPHEAIPQKQAG